MEIAFPTPSPAPAEPAKLPRGATDRAMREAAAEFEAVFLTTMLEGMFSGLSTDAPFGGGKSEKVYRSMMLGEYAKQISADGGLGIADHVYRELIAIQESTQR